VKAAIGLVLVGIVLLSDGAVAETGPRPRPLAPTIWVDDGTRSCDGNFPCYQSIIMAVNDVDALGTVIVLGSPAPYQENVFVAKPVRILGENRANVTVDGRGGLAVFTVSAGPVVIERLTVVNAQVGVNIQNPQVFLDNLFVTGVPTGVRVSPGTSAIMLRSVEILNADPTAIDVSQADGVTLDNVTVRGGGWGLAVTQTRGLAVSNSTFSSTGGTGIAVDRSSNPQIGPNNTVADGQGRGVWVNGSIDVVVRDNVIRGNRLTGLNISASVGVTVENNTIEANGLFGIAPEPGPRPWQANGGGLWFWEVDPVNVTANVVRNNRYVGIGIGGPLSTDFVLRRNVVSGNDGVGVAIVEGARNVTVAGDILGNAGDGVRVENATAVAIEGANVQGNTAMGIRAFYTANLTVSNTFVRGNGGLTPKGDADPMSAHSGGLWFWEVDPSAVVGTVVTGNLGNGITLIRTRDFDVVGNTLDANTGSGIFLDVAVNSHVDGNRVNGSAIALELNGTAALASGNTLTNATVAAILVRGGSSLFATNDTIAGTPVDYELRNASRAFALNETFGPRRFTLADAPSTLTIAWFLDVTVVDSGANPVPGAVVRVFDLAASEVFNGTSNAQGRSRWIVLDEEDVTQAATIRHTPHVAEAYLTGPDLTSAPVLMNRSRAITLTLGEDATPPLITDVTAAPDPQEATGAVNVSATVEDANLASVFLNVTYPDATSINASMDRAGTTSFLNRTYGQVGVHAFSITARDTFGNTATGTGSFAIVPPNAPPTITNVNATPDPQQVGGSVNVSATITDSDGIASVLLDLTFPDSSTAAFGMIRGTGDTWYWNQTYGQLGVHGFVITATDGAPTPKSAQATGSFRTIDTVPPTANAGPDWVVPEGTVVPFDGSASSDNVGIVNYTWTFTDVTPRTLYGVAPTYRFDRFGTYVVTLTVRDSSGNVASDAMTVQVQDQTPPQVTGAFATPSPAETPGATNVSFQVVEANTLAVVTVEGFDPTGASLGNVSASFDAGSGRYYATWPLAALGTYRFVLYAEDQSANWDADQVTVLARDTTPPTVSPVGAIPSVQEILTPVLLWAQVADPFLASVAVDVRDPQGGAAGNLTMTFNAGTGRYEASFVPTAIGPYAFTIWAADTSGNAASRGDAFASQDTGAPTLSALAVAPQPQDVGGTVDVSVVAADNYVVALVQIQIVRPSGVPLGAFDMAFNPGDGRWHYVRAYPELGNYTFVILAFDPAGNSATLGGVIRMVDTTPPVVTNLTKWPATHERGGTVTVNATATDDVGLQRVSLQVLDPTSLQIGNHTMSCDASGFCTYARAYGLQLAGTYTLRVWATDTSGNVGMAETTLVISEGSGPTADAGPDLTVRVGTTVTLDGSRSTDDFGIVSFRWTMTYRGNVINRTGATVPIRFDDAGTYVVTLTVTDAADREDTDTVVVTVEGVAGPSGGLLDWWPFLLILLLLVVVVGALVLARRRAAARPVTPKRTGPSEKPERKPSEPPAPKKEAPAKPAAPPKPEPKAPAKSDEEIDEEIDSALEELEELEEL